MTGVLAAVRHKPSGNRLALQFGTIPVVQQAFDYALAGRLAAALNGPERTEYEVIDASSPVYRVLP